MASKNFIFKISGQYKLFLPCPAFSDFSYQAQHFENNLDPEASNFNIPLKTVNNVEHDKIMTLNFGFGGTNAVLVLSKYAE